MENDLYYQRPNDNNGNKKKPSGGKLFLIVAAVIVALMIAHAKFNSNGQTPVKTDRNIVNRNNIKSIFKQQKNQKFITGKYVAELHIEGVIQEKNKTYNQQWLISTIKELKEDENNIGILLVIDSPGGTVYEADAAYLELCKYKASGKKIWAYMESLAASGGYYIACASEKIYANRNTLTGSIGVITGQSIDATELLEKIGIKSTTITAGRNKNMMNYNAPFTDEQKAIMQSIADECYEQFTGIVAESRKIPLKKVQEEIADGRIYTAKQAKANGLIDEISTFENAEESIRNSLPDEDFDFSDFSYVYEEKIWDRLSGIISNATGQKALIPDGFTKKICENLYPDVKYPAFLYQGN